MNPIKSVALALLVVGVIVLALGGFSYTRETHDAHIGPIELTVKDKRHVNLPVWAGVAAIAIGAGLLLIPRKT
jgi:hypothetical protein